LHSYPLTAVRALALHAHGLTTPLGAEPAPTPDTIANTVTQLGCVQIDTLQMVHRSHYVALWSRLGSYDPADFDRLIYAQDKNERCLYEDWMHAACILPLAEYRYRLPYKRRARDNPSRRTQRCLSQPGNSELAPHILERIRRDGPLRAVDFEYKGPQRSGWWDWKPAKIILEHLFSCGDLMIANRVNFQRVYGLRDQVLPDWVDATEPSMDESIRRLLEIGVRSFGICQPRQASDYAHRINITLARPIVQEMIDQGMFAQVEAELADGETHTLIVHRDNLPLLEQARDGVLAARRTTFLSPFDSLFWPDKRDRQLWGFHKVLEAYKPVKQRKWGYFCLPILHQDKLVGRFDPKLERKTGTLRIKALYLEPGVEPGEELVSGVAAAMRDFLAFHKANDLTIERSEPAAFGDKLSAAL